MKKKVKWTGAFGVLALVALQLVNPARQNPPMAPGNDFLAGSRPPPAVAALLKNCCYDCHSFDTQWPWYSHVAPISWYVARDVKAARASLNFSDWPSDDAPRARKRWRHVADELEDGGMPPPGYAWMHPHARLTAPQRAELAKWAREQAAP